eukprot:7287119-Pyramimonas_sp.AAC.1
MSYDALGALSCISPTTKGWGKGGQAALISAHVRPIQTLTCGVPSVSTCTPTEIDTAVFLSFS